MCVQLASSLFSCRLGGWLTPPVVSLKVTDNISSWSEMNRRRAGEELELDECQGPGPQARGAAATETTHKTTPLLRIIYPENTAVLQEPSGVTGIRVTNQ